jgi:Domain of unknown function (DUF4349)
VATLRLLSAAGVFLVLSLSLVATGCSKKMAREDAPSGVEAPKKAAAPRDEAPAQVKQPEGEKQPVKAALPRKIIYKATVRLIVEDFSKAEQELDRLIDANQGYIFHSTMQGAPPAPRSGEWQARIPVEKFKAFQSAVVKLGELQSSSLDSEDVTEQFYDLKKLIENREARENALREMYAIWSKKASKVEDIMPIDREMAQIREGINRAQGQLQVLSKLSELATVTVYLTERKGYVPPESPDFGARVGRTFGNSVEALVNFGQWLALVGVSLAPWLPLIALGLVPLWIVRRRYRSTRAARTRPPEVELVEPIQPDRGPEEHRPGP